jgi:hypothetical protein
MPVYTTHSEHHWSTDSSAPYRRSPIPCIGPESNTDSVASEIEPIDHRSRHPPFKYCLPRPLHVSLRIEVHKGPIQSPTEHHDTKVYHPTIVSERLGSIDEIHTERTDSQTGSVAKPPRFRMAHCFPSSSCKSIAQSGSDEERKGSSRWNR